jgi:hypothetical protein
MPNDSASFEYEHHKTKCGKCERKILVEILLIGVSHNANVTVICRDCLKDKGINPKFKEEHPEEAKDIEEWIE